MAKMVQMRMPFGRFEGKLICDLPVSYLEWMARKGFPKGVLGDCMQTVLVIKSNGLEHILIPLKEMFPHKS